MKSLCMILFLSLASQQTMAQQPAKSDAILGLWKADEKVLTISVYKQGTEYRARIVSFTDHHSTIPSEERRDDKNPDAAKRIRKMIGMDVLTDLSYNTADNSWTGGQIYDAGSGKTYSASAALDEGGRLSVRAFKGISLLGKTLTFHR